MSKKQWHRKPGKITKIVSRFIEYLREHLVEYYQLGVREVSDEDQANCSKYDFGKKEDLMHIGLNVNFFMYFVASTDKNSEGQLKSKRDVRKYVDAIAWGSKTAVEPLLPNGFYQEIICYIGAYNKKFAQARKSGDVDKSSTEPIPSPV